MFLSLEALLPSIALRLLSLLLLPPSTPVLSPDGTDKLLTFWSAMVGPFWPQWVVSDGAEQVKLVVSTRTLCPVRNLSSVLYSHNFTTYSSRIELTVP
jgi:hypothetical protein